MLIGKSLLFALVALNFSPAHADKFDADGILRKDDGSIRFLHHFDAQSACPAGFRLPTIREQALESESRGSKGILEIAQVGPNAVPAGYYKVSAANDDGTDEFFFSHQNFRAPAGDLGGAWFWSSSLALGNHYYAYGVSGFHGRIEKCERQKPRGCIFAIRCVRR